MNEDSVLWQCNETELLDLARRQKIGLLKRGLDLGLLIAIVGGYQEPSPEHLSSTLYSRRELEKYIMSNYGRVSSQLPGCDGHCTTYPCSEARHALCFLPNEALVQ